MAHSGETPGRISSTMYTVDSSDPDGRLIDRGSHTTEEIRQIGELMSAVGRLRETEQTLADASQRYMKLGRTDMRALQYLIIAGNTGETATPGAMAAHLGISSASTTKLLDRLERAGHITRALHPTDRRALAISITAHTREVAMETVGRQQAKRFHAAARLTSAEREVVIRFLNDMADEITLREGQWETPDASAGGPHAD